MTLGSLKKRQKLIAGHLSAILDHGTRGLLSGHAEVDRAVLDGVVQAASLDQYSFLSVWHSLQEVSHYPYVPRALAFLLTIESLECSKFQELVAAQLMGASISSIDVSTQLNLLAASIRWSQSDNGVPPGVLVVLPHFLERTLTGPAIVKETALDLLIGLTVSQQVTKLPKGFLEKTRLAVRDQEPLEETKFLVEQLEKLEGMEESDFLSISLQTWQQLRDRMSEDLSEFKLPELDAANSLVEGFVLDLEARIKSLGLNVPVQAIRVVAPSGRPSLELVTSLLSSWFKLFMSVCDGLDLMPVLTPLSAHSGSFVIHAAVNEAPESNEAFVLIRQDLKAPASSQRVSAELLRELLEILNQSGSSLEVVMPEGLPSICEPIRISLSGAKALLPTVQELATQSALDSKDIPQADDIDRVFKLVELLSQHETVEPESLGVVLRQFNYYRHAGRCLNLLNEDNYLTRTGRQVARANEQQRKMITAILFEESKFGSAWISWSKAATLVEVDPRSALDFIRSVVPNLSKVTAKRRAQTLTAWHNELAPFHYSRWQIFEAR